MRKNKTTRKRGQLTLLKASRTGIPSGPSRAKLECFRNKHPGRDYLVRFDCPEFTALCPVTGQPDFGHIQIEYVPDRFCLESKSLKLYLLSFRNHGTFHEEAVNRIMDDVVHTICPRRITVTGEFRPRGGVAISVRAAFPPEPAIARAAAARASKS